jgi:hypothetical protein
MEIRPESDLVGCDSPLQVAMAVWRAFFKFEAHQPAILICSWLLLCLT